MFVRKRDKSKKKKKVLLNTHANRHKSKTTQGEIPSKRLKKNKRTVVEVTSKRMDARRSWSWEISIFKRFGLRPTLNISPNRWDQPNSDIRYSQPGMQKTPSVPSWRFEHGGEEEEGLPDFAAKEVTHQNHICGNFYIYMSTLAVDHSREVTRVLMMHIKMAHLRRLDDSWMASMTDSRQASLQRRQGSFLQRWDVETLSFCL